MTHLYFDSHMVLLFDLHFITGRKEHPRIFDNIFSFEEEKNIFTKQFEDV